jgi:lysophospholipid hydrolase
MIEVRTELIPLQYGTLEFGKFEEIEGKGFETATHILRKLGQEGRLPSGSIDGKGSVKMSRKKGQSVRRNSI